MWDCEPILYWRVSQYGKRTWKKANAARFRTEMGTIVWVIEPPIPKVVETESETETCMGGTECTVDKCRCYDES